MDRVSCVRCSAETGVIGIELGGISTSICLTCSDIVTTVARKLAAEITQRAAAVSDALAERARVQNVVLSRPPAAWITSEVAFVCLHLVDRRAFDALAAGLRVLLTRCLMDELIPELLSHVGLTRDVPRYDEIRQGTIRSLNARQLAYSMRDEAGVFSQFTSLLTRFFTDVAPTLQPQLTAFTAKETTIAWQALEPTVRESLTSIPASTSSPRKRIRGQEPSAKSRRSVPKDTEPGPTDSLPRPGDIVISDRDGAELTVLKLLYGSKICVMRRQGAEMDSIATVGAIRLTSETRGSARVYRLRTSGSQ